MRYRLLGQTGLRVSELFLGAMIWTPDDAVDTTCYQELCSALASPSVAPRAQFDSASLHDRLHAEDRQEHSIGPAPRCVSALERRGVALACCPPPNARYLHRNSYELCRALGTLAA